VPLLDLFRSPTRERAAWESFHSQWAGALVRRLNLHCLPPRYRSAPRAHLGAFVEVDVAAFEEEKSAAGDGVGLATEVWAPSRPARTFAAAFAAQDRFEVQIYDDQRGARLVAAVELVSPRNKDRPSARRAFAVKCAALLQENVSVVVVDLVTERRDSLHAELLGVLGIEQADPLSAERLYAAAYRTVKADDAWRLDLWPEALHVGEPLPMLPLWLAADLAVPLELEMTFEETCRELRIR
jgi:hypothetical protein